MMRAGRVCEGDIAEEIKRANKELVRTTMREGKAHMRQLSEMLEASDEVMRHKVMKGRAVSTRVKVRAMSDSMPTMKHEGDKVQEGNAYHYMYEAHIEGGRCTCGSGEQETMQHIYGECKHTEAARVAAVQKVKTMWLFTQS